MKVNTTYDTIEKTKKVHYQSFIRFLIVRQLNSLAHCYSMTDIKVEKIDIVYSFSMKETSFSGKKGIR